MKCGLTVDCHMNLSMNPAGLLCLDIHRYLLTFCRLLMKAFAGQEDVEKVVYRETIVTILCKWGCTPASAVRKLSNLDFLEQLTVEAHVRSGIQR